MSVNGVLAGMGPAVPEDAAAANALGLGGPSRMCPRCSDDGIRGLCLSVTRRPSIEKPPRYVPHRAASTLGSDSASLPSMINFEPHYALCGRSREFGRNSRLRAHATTSLAAKGHLYLMSPSSMYAAARSHAPSGLDSDLGFHRVTLRPNLLVATLPARSACCATYAIAVPAAATMAASCCCCSCGSCPAMRCVTCPGGWDVASAPSFFARSARASGTSGRLSRSIRAALWSCAYAARYPAWHRTNCRHWSWPEPGQKQRSFDTTADRHGLRAT